MNTLVIDIGGSNVKLWRTGESEKIKIESGPEMAPEKMADAVKQALGSYEGGRMLYLGLGTSLGSVFIIDGKIVPLALGHLRFYKGESFEHYLGRKGLERYGAKAFKLAVAEAAATLKAAFLADYVVLGGGNAKKIEELPEGCRRGANEMAYVGGIRMWEPVENLPSLAVYPEPRAHTG